MPKANCFTQNVKLNMCLMLHLLPLQIKAKAKTFQQMLRPLRTVLLLLCLMCAHCNLAKPTNSMTRIQEVFRTLMGPKPMMLASRGKKASALFGDGDRVPSPHEFFDDGEEEPTEVLRDPAAFWVMAGERGVPVAALRSYWTAARRRR